jgi:hypothetical protein
MKDKRLYKRDFKITEEEMSFGTTYKTEMWDKYGNYSCVYERSVEDSTKYVYDWWEKSEEREESNKIRNKAIRECIEIDRKSGITSRNRDCLD